MYNKWKVTVPKREVNHFIAVDFTAVEIIPQLTFTHYFNLE